MTQKPIPNPAQVLTRDRMMADGYRHTGWRSYPTKLKRNPVEHVLVMEKVTITPRSSSTRTDLINGKGEIE